MDLDEMFSLPFGLGEQLHIAADLLPRARAGDDKEYFVPPLACPRVSFCVIDAIEVIIREMIKHQKD